MIRRNFRPERTGAVLNQASTARFWAERIIAFETREKSNVAAIVQGIRNALTRLDDHCSQLVGKVGFEALFSRALHLTQPDWPAARTLENLSETVQQEGAEKTRAGAALLFANTIGLLCSFIGDDLTFRVLERAWPELPKATSSERERA